MEIGIPGFGIEPARGIEGERTARQTRSIGFEAATPGFTIPNIGDD